MTNLEHKNEALNVKSVRRDLIMNVHTESMLKWMHCCWVFFATDWRISSMPLLNKDAVTAVCFFSGKVIALLDDFLMLTCSLVRA